MVAEVTTITITIDATKKKEKKDQPHTCTPTINTHRTTIHPSPTQHRRRRFPPSLLPTTFALQVLLLGATAVAAGGAAGAAVDAAGGSYLAPFDLCAAAAVGELLLIPWLWRSENVGVVASVAAGVGVGAGEGVEGSGGGVGGRGLWAAAREGLAVFGAGRREVLWLGLTQVCFEGRSVNNGCLHGF